MRILHLIPSMGGGGAERQLSLIAPALVRHGVEIAVAFHTKGANFEALDSGDVILFELPKRGNSHPLQLTDVGALLHQWKPDAVHSWLLQMDIIGGIMAHLCGIPHILSERSASEWYRATWKTKLRRVIGQNAAAIVANSDAGLKFWRSSGARGALTVIPNALSPRDNDPARYATHPLNGQKYFLAAGRFSEEKNQKIVAQAFIVALRAMPDHHAVIFGEGPERPDILSIIERAGMEDRIHVRGFTDKLPHWFAHATAFVSASLVEGLPNVVIEAAQAQCPLILSDIAAHREAIGLCAARFVDPASPEAFAQALVSAVQNSTETNEMTANAYSKISTLTVDNITKSYIDFYRKLLETKNR